MNVKMMKFYHLPKKYINLASVKVAIVAEAALALVMLLMVSDVFARFALNSAVRGAYELIEYLGAIIVACGIAYCGIRKGHVFVDLLVTRFPKRIQAIVRSIAGVISVGIIIVTGWQCFVHVGILYDMHLTSAVLFIPSYPFLALVGVGFVLLGLVFLIETVESIAEAIKK